MKEGTYIDTQIIELRRLYKKESDHFDITTDQAVIQNQKTKFLMKRFYDNRVHVYLPDYFAEMPEEVADIRYMFSYRPEIIMTNISFAENFAFSCMDKEEGILDEQIQGMEKAVADAAPETIIYDRGKIEGQAIEGAWFEYKSFTIDEEAYNMQFLIYSERNTLVGTFNCQMRYYDEWKPYVLKILEKIEILEEENWDEGRENLSIRF